MKLLGRGGPPAEPAPVAPPQNRVGGGEQRLARLLTHGEFWGTVALAPPFTLRLLSAPHPPRTPAWPRSRRISDRFPLPQVLPDPPVIVQSLTVGALTAWQRREGGGGGGQVYRFLQLAACNAFGRGNEAGQ